LAALANLENELELFVTASGIDDPQTAATPSFTPSRTGRTRNLLYHSGGNDYKKRLQESDEVAQRLFQIKEEYSKVETKLSSSDACTR